MDRKAVAYYSTPTRIIHWLTALLVVIAFIYGPGGREERIYSAARDAERQLHETLGMVRSRPVIAADCVGGAGHAPCRTRSGAVDEYRGARREGILYILLLAVPLTAIAGAWLEAHAVTLLWGVSIAPPIAESHAVGATIAELHGWLGDVILWLADCTRRQRCSIITFSGTACWRPCSRAVAPSTSEDWHLTQPDPFRQRIDPLAANNQTMAEAHANARLETFCDGVFAIALTLLIIDIKIPAAAGISSITEFWHALQHLVPSLFAFLLSFGVILITWVNHHGALRLVNRTSASFIYANGFLLLTVVIIPFPASLLGEFLRTDHAAPAVVLYDAALALQSIGWMLLTGAALQGHLLSDAGAASKMRANRRNAYGAFLLYGMLAIAAFWLPIAMAVVTAATWIFWLILGIRMRHD